MYESIMVTVPIVPMNWTLMPVCSNRLPSLGLIVTAPLTDSPSIYKGAFSLRFLSNFMSTVDLSSESSKTMSISTGVEKKYDIVSQIGGPCKENTLYNGDMAVTTASIENRCPPTTVLSSAGSATGCQSAN